MFWRTGPKTVIVELTNRCNLKCRMCSIWEEHPKRDFDIRLFKHLVMDPSMRGVRCLAFTGGEPFLIPSLQGYYRIAQTYLPNAYVSVSSNGYDTKRILSFLRHVNPRRTSVTLSFDGLRSHDRIRCVRDSRKILELTARKIRQDFPRIPLILKFTITPWNRNELMETALYAQQLKILFHVKMMEELPIYHNRAHRLRLPTMKGNEKNQGLTTQLKKAVDCGLVANRRYAKRLLQPKKFLSCPWPSTTLFVGLNGNVYLCRKKPLIGDLGQTGLSEILTSQRCDLVKSQMKKCGVNPCASYHP